mmetsp:Transcript_26043/g.77801  ORF Transcript_26043/g.77801 Transcript_26043/m.77801 type:complete len:98 (+) Transcript_26043:3-296(+)
MPVHGVGDTVAPVRDDGSGRVQVDWRPEPLAPVAGDYVHSRGGRVTVRPDGSVVNPYVQGEGQLAVGPTFLRFLGHTGRIGPGGRLEFSNGACWERA